MNKATRISRRDFIKLSTNALFGLSGLLALGGLLCYFDYLPEPDKQTEFDLGELTNYPIGSRTVRSDIPAVIYNRDGKISAHSLICTHLGCTIAENGAEFECPCHGSRFDENGAVRAGPAQQPLKNLRVEILEDNTLKLYTKG